METLDLAPPQASSTKSPPRDDACYVFHYPPQFMWHPLDIPPFTWEDFSIYLHVPFCRSICTFCTFERTVAPREERHTMFDAIIQEFHLRTQVDDFSRSTLNSVYLGGGTASLLTNDQIKQFTGLATRDRRLINGFECTLECEPGTKRAEDFRVLLDAGVNRISIGIQTFDPALLISLNRRHSATASRDMVTDALAAKVPIVHIDLMYGLPGQTFSQWKSTIDEAVALGVNHISVYRLIVFSNELLFRRLARGEMNAIPPVSSIEEMRLYSLEALGNAGFKQYSLTEFAREGKECKYVRSNWDGSDYLGFGPAAYSRYGKYLWQNSLFHHEYYASLQNGKVPVGRGFKMTPVDMVARDIAMGLCLLNVDLNAIAAETGIELPQPVVRSIDELCRVGYMTRKENTLYLTQAGVRYATYVMKEFAT